MALRRYGMALVVSVSFCLGSALEAQLKTDFDGAINGNGWLVLGPFAQPFGCVDGAHDLLLDNFIAPSCIQCAYPEFEEEVDYDPAVAASTAYVGPLSGDSPFWRPFDDGTDDGDQVLDSDIEVGDQSDVVAYLATYIENTSAEDVFVDFCVGSDDAVLLLLDDTILLYNNVCRGNNRDCQDLVQNVRITPGGHRVAAAVFERGGGWAFSLALLMDGEPVLEGETAIEFLGFEKPEIAGGEACVCPTCPPVTGLGLNSETGVAAWTNPGAGEGCTGIEVSIDGELVASLEPDVTTFTVPVEVLEGASEVCIDNGYLIPTCRPVLTPTEVCVTGVECFSLTGAVGISWTQNPAINPTQIAVRRDGVPIAGSPFAGDTVSVSDPDGLDGSSHVYSVVATFGAPFETSACAAQCPFDPAAAKVFLADDFESYATDDDVLAAGYQIVEVNDPIEFFAKWTITNLKLRKNPAGERGMPTRGQFIISDSDGGPGAADGQGSGRSHDLITPPFDTSGSDTVWLHVDASVQLNDNGTVIFDIDVSIDGGEEWETVFRRIAPSRGVDPLPDRENTDGFFGRLHVDVSGAAANSPEVLVRFRQFEPDWDWFFALDNLRIDDVPHVGGSAVLLELESFEDAEIPADWEVRSEAPDENEEELTWTAEDTCFVDATPAVGGLSLNRQEAPYALINQTCALDQATQKDEYLITPVIDCSLAGEVFLHFRSETLPEASATQEVLVSIDAGQTFLATPLFIYDHNSLYDPGEDPLYAERILSAPAAAGQAQVAFAFRYARQAGNADPGSWWAIDDVQVTATQAAGITFLRGDCNADGVVDVSDPVASLAFQFAGGTVPPCVDGCDFDDSGVLDTSDPIVSLTLLFLGGVQPPPPGLETCGLDPTADELSCESFPPCEG